MTDQFAARVHWLAVLTILYGLFVIWTGLQATIQAHVFKPNAFWFCMVLGIVQILGGLAIADGKLRFARIFTAPSTLIVLGYYLFTFMTNSAEDANYRVGLIIVFSFGQLAVIFFPQTGD